MAEGRTIQRGIRKERSGKVVSKSGDKSIVVLVEKRIRHPLYNKVITHSKKFHVDDPENKAAVGDKVRIVECRPISKSKRWRLVEVPGGDGTGTGG